MRGAVLSEAPINEASTLLRNLFPDRSREIEARGGRSAEYLRQRGIKLGGEKDLEITELRDRANFMVTALDRAGIYCSAAAAEAVIAIRSSRRLELASQITSTVGASSVLGALGLDSKVGAVVAGIFTLVASLATLIAAYRTRLIDDQSGNMQTSARTLMQLAYDTIMLKEELTFQIETGTQERLADTVSRANELCRSVLQESMKYDGEFTPTTLKPAMAAGG